MNLVDRRYQLIDFGRGRKLESLAGYLVDRPSPAAVGTIVRSPAKWKHADATYNAEQRVWEYHRPWPAGLTIDCGLFGMPIRPTPYGHIGLFPEQRLNWL